MSALRLLFLCCFWLSLGLGSSVGADSAPADPPQPVLIGLDAEFGHRTSTSAQAIQ